MSARDPIAVVRTDQKFLLLSIEFTQQFSHMYFQRLELLKPRAQRHALGILGLKESRLRRALDMEMGDPCICVGTIYKHCSGFKGFLKAYTEEQVRLVGGGADDGDDDDDAMALDEDVSFRSTKETDVLVIEDESGRLQLEGNCPIGALVTGMIVAVFGQLKEGRKLHVENWMFCGASPQIDRKPWPTQERKWIAFISGFKICERTQLSHELLIDFLCGNIRHEHSVSTKDVGRLIVAGNLIGITDDVRLKGKVRLDPQDHIKPADRTNPRSSASCMREVDRLLLSLSEVIDVDVMPGELDPTNCFLPQQPLHPLLLPSSSRNSTTHLVPNPYQFTVPQNGTQIFVSSGQNLSDALQQVTTDALTTLENMVQSANLFPTAPNTLACYPFKDTDPFLLQETPHCIVVGNQAKFETTLLNAEGINCRLVTLPSWDIEPGIVFIEVSDPSLKATYVKLGDGE
jgi:DNA polymerase delta subunit 2